MNSLADVEKLVLLNLNIASFDLWTEAKGKMPRCALDSPYGAVTIEYGAPALPHETGRGGLNKLDVILPIFGFPGKEAACEDSFDREIGGRQTVGINNE